MEAMTKADFSLCTRLLEKMVIRGACDAPMPAGQEGIEKAQEALLEVLITLDELRRGGKKQEP